MFRSVIDPFSPNLTSCTLCISIVCTIRNGPKGAETSARRLFDGAFFIRGHMRTLVLNAGYEPLGVVSFKRAIILVLNQKATVLSGDSNFQVHSAKEAVELPRVILLSRYVRVPHTRQVPLSRRGVLRRDSNRCAYCNRSANTIDHVQPKSRGGQDTWENLVACCLKCNNAKGDKTLQELGWELSFTPRMPSGLAWTIRGAETVDPDWIDFLEAA